MCGRFTLKSPGKLRQEFEFDQDYNLEDDQILTPGKKVLAIKTQGDKTLVTQLFWGLKPTWDTNKSTLIFNARAETLEEKHFFSKLLDYRCVIPASGYFEWKKIDEKHKQPYFFTPKDFELFYFAGLYQPGLNPSCTLITTVPNTLTASVHARMPAILTRENINTWLHPDPDTKFFLTAFDPNKMSMVPLN